MQSDEKQNMLIKEESMDFKTDQTDDEGDDVDLSSSSPQKQKITEQVVSPLFEEESVALDERSESDDSVALDDADVAQEIESKETSENKNEQTVERNNNIIDITDESESSVNLNNVNENVNNIECVSIGSSDEEEEEINQNKQGNVIDGEDNDEGDEEEEDDEDMENEQFELSSDEEEEYHPSFTTKRMHKLIEELIPLVGSGGSFSVGGEFHTYPSIGLQLLVPNSENNTVERKYVSLPLVTKQQADDIIQLAAKAPYGRGEETIVDERVRKTWQLEPNQFTILNPNWEDMIDDLIQNQVKKGLGVGEKEIGFNLYKLLLYEEDGHFDLHRDSEKEENMFATLIIHLPSIYTGGELIVKHNSKEVTYDYSSKASYATSYISFYCDCEHKVNRVTSGYRLALVYNIFFEGPSNQTPTANTNENVIEYMNDTLNIWEEKYIIHILEHKYTKDGISVENLKGTDARVYNWFENYNRTRDAFYLCVGQLTKEVTGDLNDYSGYRGYSYRRYHSYGDSDEENDEEVDSEDLEEKETSYMVNNLKDRKGHFSSRLSPVDVSSIIPLTSLLEIPHQRSTVEHTGNAGVNASKFYTSACLVIIPKKTFGSLLHNLDDNCKLTYFNMMVNNQTKNPSISNIKKITDLISSNYLSENILMSTIEKVKDVKVAVAISGKNISYTSWQYLIANFGLQQLKTQFLKFIISNLNNKQIIENALQTIQSQNDSHLISQLCYQVFDYLRSKQGVNYIDFIQKLLNCMKEFAIPLVPNTAKYMAERCKKTESPNEVTVILNFLEPLPEFEYALLELIGQSDSFIKNYPLIIGYFNSFYNNNIQSCLEPILKNIVSSNPNQALSLFNYCSNLTNNPGARFISSYIRANIVQQFVSNTRNIDLENCKAIISTICKNGIPDDLSSVTATIISKITDLNAVIKILIPLIKFIENTYGRPIFSTYPSFSVLIHCTIGFLNPIFKKQQETNANDWRIPTNIGCPTNCSHCQKVNIFLQSSTSQICEIKEALGIRNHVEHNIGVLLRKYLSLDTIRSGSPHTLVIKKISNPQIALAQQANKTKALMLYLNGLLSNSQNIPQVSTSDLDSIIEPSPQRTTSNIASSSHASNNTSFTQLLNSLKRPINHPTLASKKKR